MQFCYLSTAVLRISRIYAEAGYRHLGQRFQKGGAGIDFGEVLWVVGSLTVAVTAIWLIVRTYNKRFKPGYRNPKLLFKQLCQVHGLGFRERSLLKQLANAYSAESAGVVFVQRSLFDTAKLPQSLRDRASELRQLEDRIFGKREVNDEITKESSRAIEETAPPSVTA